MALRRGKSYGHQFGREDDVVSGNFDIDQTLQSNQHSFDDTASSEDEYDRGTSSGASRYSHSSISDDQCDAGREEEVVKSIEVPHNDNGYRDFSTATAFHIRRESESSLADKVDRAYGQEHDIRAGQRFQSDTAAKGVFEALRRLHKDARSSPSAPRGVSLSESDVFSAMPEDLDILDKYTTERTSQRPQSRGARDLSSRTSSHAGSDDVFRRSRRQSSKLSTPVKFPFRDSSSVREMLLSAPSPNPFPTTPRSPRYSRRLSTTSSHHNTPLRNTQILDGHLATPSSQHPNPEKEYPLVLLQCTISPSNLPYSQEVVQKILPKRALQDIGLLSRKMTGSILERGLLISHPGDDYDLLEERILESLNLKSPRIGQCGHFMASTSSEAGDDVFDGTASMSSSSAQPCRCDDCGRHVAFSCDHLRRWDIKVFAANGLMSAGAWAASWRQMEKVDLEIGIHVSDERRQILEDEQNIIDEKLFAAAVPQEPAEIFPADAFQEEMPAPQCTPPPSTRRRPASPDVHKHRGSPAPTPVDGPLPLSTLFTNYIKRHAAHLAHRTQQSIIIPVLLGVLLLCAASFLIINGAAKTETLNSSWAPTQDVVPGLAQLGAAAAEGVTAHVSRAVLGESLPACTFPVAEAGERAMTAVPVDVARRIMEGWGSATTAVGGTATAAAAAAASTARAVTASAEEADEVVLEAGADAVTAEDEDGVMLGTVGDVVDAALGREGFVDGITGLV